MISLDLLNPADYHRVRSLLEFSTRSILRPFLPLRLLQNVATGVADWVCDHNPSCAEERLRKEEIRFLLKKVEEVTTLDEYEKCTKRLDVLQGHETWKRDRYSIEPEYNPDVIETQTIRLKDAAVASDLSAMQHLLRTGLSRELGGMNVLRLHKHTWHGTKQLIHEYIDAATATVDKYVETCQQYDLPVSELQFYQQSLEDSLKYFGRSALTLSGGALLGMKHIGVVKALHDANLLPRIISGASAGSIVAAIVCSKNDSELKDALDYFPSSNLACFDPENTTLFTYGLHRLRGLYRDGKLFAMDRMGIVMREWLGDITFREARHKTGRILNICVSSADSEPRLLNYITAPDVYIWSAVCASCSVPGIFKAATILEKDPLTKEPKVWMQSAKQLWVDGSLDHDIPMRKLSEMFNVNLLITSQVNPHVRLFLEPEETFIGIQPRHSKPKTRMRGWLKSQARQALVHRAQQLADMGVHPVLWRAASLLKQQYTGDINIFPLIDWTEYLIMLINPTPNFMRQAMKSGEQATFPKMSRIKNCVALELKLIEGIHKLRDQVHFSSEAKAARQSRPPLKGGRRRGRGSRPAFKRQRSLSTEYIAVDDGYCQPRQSAPPTPGPGVKRNVSVGSLFEKLSAMAHSGQPAILSPQAGIELSMANGITAVVDPVQSVGFETESRSVNGYRSDSEDDQL